jgi:hypothetical protein
MMRTLLFGLAALPFLASITLAAQPLTNEQMDKVTAGGTPIIVDTLSTSGLCSCTCSCPEEPAGPPNGQLTSITVLSPQLPFSFSVIPSAFSFPF